MKAFSYLTLILCLVSGCGMVPVMTTPTRYEDKIPAQFDIAKNAQGKVAVLVQGAPTRDVRMLLTDAILNELKEKTDLKKVDLIPAEAIDNLRKDETRYLAMDQGQIGGAVGAGTVLAVKIVNYGLYPAPMGSYYDASVKVSASIIDVRTAIQLWPRDSAGREVSLTFDAEAGSAEAVSVKVLVSAAHGIARYLYDCPKAYWNTPGEPRSLEWDN
jgi:hypothetical protein